MVSRFPQGSPINLNTGQIGRFLLAEFNKELTAEELVGKLKAVLFDDGVTYDAVADIDTTSDPPMLVLSYGNGTVPIEIEGNKLYANNEAEIPYIFDLDFDGQHRKNFEQPDGTYIMMVPDLLLPRQQGQEKKYLVVKTSLSDGDLNIRAVVNNQDEEEGWQPKAADPELTDVDVDTWFTDAAGQENMVSIVSLISAIFAMEYHVTGDVGAGGTIDEQLSIDGQFNPFTDGSPYTPLVMTSRLNNSQPVEVSQTRQLLATFNRDFTAEELVDKIKMVFGVKSEGKVYLLDSVTVQSETTASIADNEGENTVGIIIEGHNLYVVNNGGDDGFVFDVDYDEQHKRALTIQASPTPLLYYLDSPTLIPGNPGRVCIYAYNDDLPYFEIVKTVGDGLIAVYTGLMPPQGVQANENYILGILTLMLSIEFTNFNDLDIGVHPIEQDTTTMIAGVNLLEVTTMPSA